jgi:hypothetical protein
MNDIRIRVNGRMNRPGFGIFLVFILAIGLAAMIMIMYSESYNPFAAWQGTEKDRYSAPDAKPWEEEKMFWGGGPLEGYDMSRKRSPFGAQPKITDEWRYEAKLFDGDKSMGTIKMAVFKNLDAIASWLGEFDISGKHYSAELRNDQQMNTMLNAYSGNIYPLKIYQDNKGKDRTKLYVITRGPYELKGPQKEDVRKGVAYISAWVSKDLSAEGMLSIHNFDDGKDLILKWGPVYPQKK